MDFLDGDVVRSVSVSAVVDEGHRVVFGQQAYDGSHIG